MNYFSPSLIDHSTFINMQSILQKCHETRIRIYSIILNISVVIFFCFLFGLGLYYSRSKKLSPYEQNVKTEKSKAFILSKIREYQQIKLNNWSISNLPDIYTPVRNEI